MSELLSKWIGHVSSAAAHFGGIFIWAMTGLITVEVVGRKIFSWSTLAAPEMSAYSFIAIVFLGGAYTLKIHRHVRVELLIDRVSPRARDIMTLSAIALALVYTILFTYQCLQLTLASFFGHELSIDVSKTPLFIPRLFMPLGGILLILQFMSEAIQIISSFNKSKTDMQQIKS